MKAPRAYDSSVQNLFTTTNNKTARIPVDSQQTSFEENRQFRFFDDVLISKTSGAQLVYKVSAVNPFILFNRTIGFYQGGAIYRIYANDGSHTFDDGLLGDPVSPFPVNGDLSDSGLPSHPASTITLEKAEGVNIFTAGSLPKTGTSVRSGTNNSQSSGALASDAVRLGFPDNFSAYIVFTVINGLADDSKGEYELYFEERF